MSESALVVSQSGQVTGGLVTLVAAQGQEPVTTLVTDRPENGEFSLSPATTEGVERWPGQQSGDRVQSCRRDRGGIGGSIRRNRSKSPQRDNPPLVSKITPRRDGASVTGRLRPPSRGGLRRAPGLSPSRLTPVYYRRGCTSIPSGGSNGVGPRCGRGTPSTTR